MGTRSMLALSCTLALAGSGVVAAEPGPDPHRPEVHFAPARNWVNDPNGPVWHDGRYHLYFQHNPEGDQWGNMSWGHAVSTDLLHWEERPVAIPATEAEHIFSGTVVVDEQDTSGFGSPGSPAMVAVYTSADQTTGVQAQSLAWSTDGGDTWHRYEQNPVLDIGSREFRDPKVFWYAEGGYWVMAVAMATDRTIAFYRSPDLRSWTHLSDFGPAHAVDGVWEMPDLFELPVDGDPDDTRWVLVVNLNPGSVAGGSGAQYFVGDFDGTAFTPDRLVTGDEPPPPGRVVADFEQSGYADGWTTTGTAFGTGPARGTLDGQSAVSGHEGERLVNSFLGRDPATGTLTSPEILIDRDHMNLLVGGGDNPHVPSAGDGSAPSGVVIGDFEGGDFGGWTVEGTAFGSRPTAGVTPCQVDVSGYLGDGLANSFQHGGADPCDPSPDSATGTLTSPDFTVSARYLSFLVGGGPHEATAVRLLVDGRVVRSTSGAASGALEWATWDLTDLRGRTARVQVLDAATGGWGHIMADHVVMSDEPARPRSTETAVNLLVDGEVVRTATGQDSERLDRVSWDVRALRGRTARLQVVDASTAGWGHVLLDQVVLADAPAPSRLERFDWVDYGRDFYAALTFDNDPSGRRIAVAWMNNWEYAAATPTQGWRGSMSLPRELRLTTVDDEVRLTQHLLEEMDGVRTSPPFRLAPTVLRDEVWTLPRAARGAVLEITAELEVGTARELGLHVRVGGGERTVVGYDVGSQRLFVDRTGSGDVGFHPGFAGVQSALLPADEGVVRLTVVVDRSSVEVLGGQGEVAITDLVYPQLDSDGVAVYATGGEARVRSLTVTPLG